MEQLKFDVIIIGAGISGCICALELREDISILLIDAGEEIDKRKCVLVKEDVWEVFCDLDYDINSFGKMSLIVGKWNLKLKPSMLFRKIKKINIGSL